MSQCTWVCRFSFRQLHWLVGLIQVILVLVAGCAKSSLDSSSIARAIECLGGSYETADGTLASPIVEVNLTFAKLRDDDLDVLKSLSELRSLDVQGSSLTDRALKTIGRLRSLESLNLADTTVDDTGMEKLKGRKGDREEKGTS